jgi:hypothetical protein
MPQLIKSIAPSIPEVRCPVCFNLMKIKALETLPENTVDLTYRCEQCQIDTKRMIQAPQK